MKKHNLKNGYMLVKEVERSEEDAINASGFYVPKSTLDDEQVSQGLIVQSNNPEYPEGAEVLFHKVLPIDFNMKLNGDTELKTYFFVKEKSIIDVLTE